MNDYLWQSPQALMLLRKNEIHVWLASLDQPSPVLDFLLQTLSTDERVRSERYHFERDRKHFIASRGILRMILSSYLKTNPGRIEFQYKDHGKPALDDLSGITNPNFNLSHSAGLAIYAVVRDQEIGVDLEKIRPVPDMERITANLFSRWESEKFHMLPEPAKLEAFFNCWTRKEAYLKARGGGLSLALDQFAVSFLPEETAKYSGHLFEMDCKSSFNPMTRLSSPSNSIGLSTKLLGGDEGLHETADWSISAFTPAPGFTAALAVLGCNWRIKYWAWG